MSQAFYVANPISREQIRKITNTIRELLGLQKDFMFPIVEFIEFVMPQIDNEFKLEICSEKEMGNQHGLTYPEKSLIILREDVYENAIQGNGRDRLTIAHEVGHYFLHRPQSIALAKVSPGERIITYCDPEWQANAFAGELLVPYKLVKGLTPEQVSELCGVSYTAAKYQLSKYK